MWLEPGLRFRDEDSNSAGLNLQPASLETSAPVTLPSSAPIAVGALPAGALDVIMDEYDKENVVAEVKRRDSPSAEDTQYHQPPRSPAKVSAQASRRQSTSAKNSPLGPASARTTSPAKKHEISGQPSSRPSSAVKKAESCASSPIKQSGNRRLSRPTGPFKWTPARGKNEHFETTPTGFRYTIELPESKIVPKKEGGATPNKATITPVKNTFAVTLADSPTKSVSPRRVGSPSKSRSQSPHKEVLKRVVRPEKKGASAPGGAKPSLKATPPRSSNHRKRDLVKLTKTDGGHAGSVTVEITRDVCSGVQLREPLTPVSGSIGMEGKGGKIGEGECGPRVEDTSGTPSAHMHIGYRGETPVNGEKEVHSRKPAVSSSVSTNFGEILRNSSQDVLQKHAGLNGQVQKKEVSSSPTILDKARRKSDIKTVSFLEVVTKLQLNSKSLVEDAIASVSKDFANGAATANVNEASRSSVEAHKSSKHSRTPSTNSPRTPTGTPPALLAAIKTEMSDLRTSLRRSMGDDYVDARQSPDATDVGNTPRLNLHKHMAAAKENSPPKVNETVHARKTAPPVLPFQTNNKAMAEAQSPFRSRLPRLSPTKSKAPGTIPQAPRTSPFDLPHTALLSHSGVPAMASRRTLYARASHDEGEIVGFASAEEIAGEVRKWNITEPEEKCAVRPRAPSSSKTMAKTPSRSTLTPRPKPTFMSPTATSAQKRTLRSDKQTYTPSGSPAKPTQPTQPTHLPRSPHKTHIPPRKASSSPTHPLPPLNLKNPKIRALAGSCTPLPRSNADRTRGGTAQGALRAPSREMVRKLDKEIDRHLESQEREGRVYTPSGQRIRDLLAKTRRSDR